jgi:hypothetical protein
MNNLIPKGDAPKPIAQLIVTQFNNGQVTVTGPIGNQIQCYGLLKVAENIICEQHQKPAEPANQIIPITQLPALNGHRG